MSLTNHVASSPPDLDLDHVHIPPLDHELFICRCLHDGLVLLADTGILQEGGHKRALAEAGVGLQEGAANPPGVASSHAVAHLRI